MIFFRTQKGELRFEHLLLTNTAFCTYHYTMIEQVFLQYNELPLIVSVKSISEQTCAGK